MATGVYTAWATATAHDVVATVDATVEIGASAIATAHDVAVTVDDSATVTLECAQAVAIAWPVTVTVQDRPATDSSSKRYAVVRPTARQLETSGGSFSSGVVRRSAMIAARVNGSRVGTVSRTIRAQ